MKKWIALLLVAVAGSIPAQAQLLKQVLNAAVKRYEAKTLSYAEGSVETALRKSALSAMAQQGYRDAAYFLEDGLAEEAVFKGHPALLAENKRLGEELFYRYLENNFILSRQAGQLAEAVSTGLYTGAINYADLIPFKARLIMLGEIHEKQAIVSEVEKLIKVYKAMYPDRTVYYASEFVDAADLSLPFHKWVLGPKQISSRVTKRPFYKDLTLKMQAAGVKVIGLENPLVSAEVVRENYRKTPGPAAQRHATLAGTAERNRYWAAIINRIYQEDPSAVVFVHAGMAHTSYRVPGSLPSLLPNWRKFVIEMDQGSGWNPLVEQYLPVKGTVAARISLIKRQNKALYPKLRVVRAVKDKKWVGVMGCHLHISFFRPEI